MTTSKCLPFAILLLFSVRLYSQVLKFENHLFRPVNVSVELSELNGKEVIRVTKNPSVKEFDEPTFARLEAVDFQNGTIEVMVYSKLLPDAPAFARGFIGIAFRINGDNNRFESIYIRPTNARVDDQLRRNRSIQYFSYPEFKFERLRKEAPGQYESYADMGLGEWIKMNIVINGSKALLFLNNNPQPSLVVNDLKHGPDHKGAIGLFVDIGTEGFFSGLKITGEN